MKTSRLFGPVLSAALLATAFVPLADAGGGMGIGSGTTACRVLMGGANPAQVVSLDVETLPATEIVRPGAPLLVCDLPTVGSTVIDPKDRNPPPPTVLVTNPTHVVCYPVQGSDKQKHTATLQDPFTLSEPDTADQSRAITLGGIRLLCVQAVITDITPQ